MAMLMGRKLAAMVEIEVADFKDVYMYVQFNLCIVIMHRVR